MTVWLVRAGWLAWPIGACAFLGLTLFFERWIALSARRILPDGDRSEALAAVRERRVEGALDDLAGGAVQSLLRAVTGPGEGLRPRMDSAGAQIVAKLERGVGWLATIASVAPLLGLTGTILGMIKVFQKVTDSGVGDPTVLAGGIWVALITTALGLLVAIPCLVLHRLLLGRVEARVTELERLAETLVRAAEKA
jgi:biopolymer transport protein ExbB